MKGEQKGVRHIEINEIRDLVMKNIGRNRSSGIIQDSRSLLVLVSKTPRDRKFFQYNM
ncbi:hypothetical protein YC2023_006494 [Brassica napus]